jgi:hypothetical protein
MSIVERFTFAIVVYNGKYPTRLAYWTAHSFKKMYVRQTRY